MYTFMKSTCKRLGCISRSVGIPALRAEHHWRDQRLTSLCVYFWCIYFYFQQESCFLHLTTKLIFPLPEKLVLRLAPNLFFMFIIKVVFMILTVESVFFSFFQVYQRSCFYVQHRSCFYVSMVVILFILSAKLFTSLASKQ